MTNIELLYFEGCPSWATAWAELGRVVVETGTQATIRLRDIAELPEHERTGFAGSPTIRIDGLDLEGYDGPSVLACRRYPQNDGRGWPTREQLRESLLAAAGGASG
jgi:hypothetical protein